VSAFAASGADKPLLLPPRARQASAAPALPRRLRRRAGSHKPYTQLRRPNVKRARLLVASASASAAAAVADADADADAADAPPQAPPRPSPAWLAMRCRRARRRPAALLRAALAPPAAAAAASGGASPPPRRLPTHAWHAKRFRMALLPGLPADAACMHVAAGLVGAGRGSRAFLRFARRRCVAHDASYLRPLQLSGHEGALRTVLRSLTSDHADDAAALGCAEVRSGGMCASLMLHAPGGSGRFRAPLAPAQLQWRPRAPLAPSSQAAPPRVGALWLWVHASAVDDVMAAAAPVCAAAGVSLSLRVDLCRFELVGATATALAARVLAPCGGGGGAWPCGEEAAPDGTVASARCRDPRTALRARARTEEENDTAADDADADGDADGEEASPPRPPRAFWPADASHADEPLLWCADVAHAPAPHAVLCAAAAASRRFRIEHGDDAAQKRDDADAADAGADDAANPSCRVMPALLLRRGAPAAASSPELRGWSVVAPAAWAVPLWTSLIAAGAAAAGRVEWGWLASDARASLFPEHFPDTPAGARAAAAKAGDDAAAAARRPKGKRAPAAAPPPWLQHRSSDDGDGGGAAGVYVARTVAAAAAAISAQPSSSPPASPASPLPLPFRGALLRVRVTLPGRGVARPGAALYALSASEAAADDGHNKSNGRETWRSARGGGESGNEDEDDPAAARRVCIGRVLAAAPAGARRTAGALALCDAAALAAARGPQRRKKGRPLRCLLATDVAATTDASSSARGVLRAALAWVCVEDAAHGRDACWDA
jgi:hypothetical protein